MDALQQQQSHMYMRAPSPPQPPPPSMSDPHQPPPRPPPPPPPQATWYPNQFQYQASQPPPQPQPPQQPHPQHSVWSNNHSDQQQQQQPISSSTYPTPNQISHTPPPPYPTHPPPQPPQNHYYPPLPQQPPPYSQPPHSYPQHNTHQAWGNPNWPHHQVWEHPDRNNPNNHEEYWAAKARAWAAANSATDSQHQPSQFAHNWRLEEINHGFQDQYPRTVDPQYANFQQPSLPASGHHHLSVSTGDPNRTPTNQLQDSLSFSSGSSSYYASDLHASYAGGDGALSADPNPVYPHNGNIPTNSSGYQQEVPSSYSSVPGKGEVGGQDVQVQTASPFSISSGQEIQHHVQPPPAASSRSVAEEQPYFTYSAGPVPDPSDRPLEFAPGFNHNREPQDQYPQSSYMHSDPAGSVGYVDHGTAVPSISSLTPPVVPGMGYPSSGPQFDPSFTPHVPLFGQIPGPNFRPTGSTAFGLGAGNILHPASAFPADPNGFNNVPDRPKKASVPNWLREEIIKKKAVIANSSQEQLEEDPDNPAEEDNIDKSYVKRGSEDSRSIDSSRSPDNDDDSDEVGLEAARTAAINQEIKRVVTDVLLKVTEELFEEIAIKVLSEEDLLVDVGQNHAPANQMLLPSSPSVPAPKASAKVLIPVRVKETDTNDASGKSNGSAGDVLGLVSYASDDDEYDESESSSKSIKGGKEVPPPLVGNKLSEDMHEVVENGGPSQAGNKGPPGTHMDNGQDKTDITNTFGNPTVTDKLRRNEVDTNPNHKKDDVSISHKGDIPSQEGTFIDLGEKIVLETGDLKSVDIVGGRSSMKADLPQGGVGSKSLTDVSQGSQARRKSDKNQEQESKKSSSSKDFGKEPGSGNLKVDSKRSGESRKDERHAKKETGDDRHSIKERGKDRGSRSGDKARESDSRRSSYGKDDKTEHEKAKRDDAKDDGSRKRVREKDEKEDRSRHHGARDPSSHKRRHSPSVGGRGRNSKDNSIGSHPNESSDDDSENSRRRKKHSKKRSLSPSPTRSRRRQVSRSPHSKHSHRRQSPYSSLESRRGRRSRSNSPVRRRR